MVDPIPPPPAPRRPSWAYAYRMDPPQSVQRLRALKTLLAGERKQARLEGRSWEARFVVEEQLTHILVVSDSPRQDLEANQRLEVGLRKLDAVYSLTLPMPVPDGSETEE
jgi:hypothetical protein